VTHSISQWVPVKLCISKNNENIIVFLFNYNHCSSNKDDLKSCLHYTVPLINDNACQGYELKRIYSEIQ